MLEITREEYLKALDEKRKEIKAINSELAFIDFKMELHEKYEYAICRFHVFDKNTNRFVGSYKTYWEAKYKVDQIDDDDYDLNFEGYILEYDVRENL